ncbi:hypothetical protein D9M71_781440 [compost metagenome]
MQFTRNPRALLLLQVHDPLVERGKLTVRQAMFTDVQHQATGKNHQYGNQRERGDRQNRGQYPGSDFLPRLAGRHLHIVDVYACAKHPAPTVQHHDI